MRVVAMMRSAPSPCQGAAVDVERRAGDHAALVGGKEEDELDRGRAQALLVAVDEDDNRAFADETVRCRAADHPGAAGDDGDLALEPQALPLVLLLHRIMRA